MEPTKYPESCFKSIDEFNLKRVWQWRNQERIRRNMHSDQTIEWQTHLDWYKKLCGDLKREFYIFHQDERPIGVLNFTWVSENAMEWGCYLGETNVWPGSGLLLEIAALDYASFRSVRSVTELIAEVLSFNEPVIRLHNLFKYKLLAEQKNAGIRDDEHYSVLEFGYQTAQWRDQRASLLSRLPKQISQAAQLISFQRKGEH